MGATLNVGHLRAPYMTAPSPALIGIAGVHHVVSEFSLRNLVALPTIRNTAAYDIIVATPDGTKHANIQVKTSLKRVNFFPMPSPERIKVGPRDWYVLLRWVAANDAFEGFMLSAREARAEVEKAEASQQKSIAAGRRTKLFPCIYVGPQVEQQALLWRKRWLSWGL